MLSFGGVDVGVLAAFMAFMMMPIIFARMKPIFPSLPFFFRKLMANVAVLIKNLR